jgi:hypothetical protein
MRNYIDIASLFELIGDVHSAVPCADFAFENHRWCEEHLNEQRALYKEYKALEAFNEKNAILIHQMNVIHREIKGLPCKITQTVSNDFQLRIARCQTILDEMPASILGAPQLRLMMSSRFFDLVVDGNLETGHVREIIMGFPRDIRTHMLSYHWDTLLQDKVIIRKSPRKTPYDRGTGGGWGYRAAPGGWPVAPGQPRAGWVPAPPGRPAAGWGPAAPPAPAVI